MRYMRKTKTKWVIYQYIDGEVKITLELGEKIYIRKVIDQIHEMELNNVLDESIICPN